MGSSYTNKTLENYLLGILSDEEQEQIERQYLADSDFFDELLAVEDDLMDDYVRGELNASEREQFEKHLLATPQQREKLRYARMLLERMPTIKPIPEAKEMPSRPQRLSWFAFFRQRRLIPILAIGFVLLICAIGGIWLLTRIRQLQSQLEQVRAEQTTAAQREQELQVKLAGEQQEKDDLLRQLQQERESSVKTGQQGKTPDEKPTTPSVMTLTLLSTLMRGGGEAANFTIPPDIEFVQLQAQLPDGNYQSFRAELQTADGESVYNLTRLKARQIATGKALFLRIPAKLLKKRDYVLKVSGLTKEGAFEDAGFYSFRITRK